MDNSLIKSPSSKLHPHFQIKNGYNGQKKKKEESSQSKVFQRKLNPYISEHLHQMNIYTDQQNKQKYILNSPARGTSHLIKLVNQIEKKKQGGSKFQLGLLPPQKLDLTQLKNHLGH